MSTSEERKKILNMVAEGKITAEEGSSLLKALQGAAKRSAGESQGGYGVPTTLRVRVVDAATGRSKVNVNVPLSLVDVAMRMGARFVPELGESDYNELLAAIRAGQRGKIIEVEDDVDGERVEIFVE
jgi:hypothetical protein